MWIRFSGDEVVKADVTGFLDDDAIRIKAAIIHTSKDDRPKVLETYMLIDRFIILTIIIILDRGSSRVLQLR